MKLEDMRERIDEIDRQMVRLYEERMKISEEVAEFKIETGKKIFDKTREKQKLASVENLATTPFNKLGVRELFDHIMSMSRKLQYRLLTERNVLGKLPFITIEKLEFEGTRVAFQGVKGAYSHLALHRFFGEDVNTTQVETFRDAMECIEEGAADFAILPIENSSAGAVSEVYDLLVEFENYIIGEVLLPVDHALVGLDSARIEDIKKVYSHPQALMQSNRFLDKHRYMEQISVVNTAVAATKVKEDGEVHKAAICSEYAAELYGLKILESHINHNKDNYTRFIIISNQKVFLKDSKKISICFEIPHYSGSLYHLLSHFIYNNLNLTKIESRPISERRWEYRFFVDFEGNMEDPAVKNAIRGMREESKNLKILGNY